MMKKSLKMNICAHVRLNYYAAHQKLTQRCKVTASI